MRTLRTALLIMSGIFIASFALTLTALLGNEVSRPPPFAKPLPYAPSEEHLFTPPKTPRTASSSPPKETSPIFVYSFNVPGTLEETVAPDQNGSPYWFLSSGGRLHIEGGIGSTIQGSLPTYDRWRLAYAYKNPIDTDNGLHPQNLFRLLTKRAWQNTRVETSFKVVRDNFSVSANRNASNGLLLMSRYQDQNTLYYAGIRVDGTAVIKKKYRGTYYTMAQVPIRPGTYDPRHNENFLPHETWIALRADTRTHADGSVSLSLYEKQETDSGWILRLSAKDPGSFGGTPPITEGGHVGIRTDFMDVLFRDFRVTSL